MEKLVNIEVMENKTVYTFDISDDKVGVVSDLKNLELPKIVDAEKTFNSLVDTFRKEEDKVEKSRLKSAFILLKIYDYELYKLGFSNIYDFASDNFGLGRTSVNEALNVARRFGSYITKSVYIKDYDEPVDKYTPSYKLDGRFTKYNFSQLYYIRKLTDDQIEQLGITPECSVRAIRETVNNFMNRISSGEEEIEEVDVTEVSNDTDETDNLEGDSVNNGSSVDDTMNKPVEEKNVVGLINLDDLMDKPLLLEPSNKGYILSLDDKNNLVIKKAK